MQAIIIRHTDITSPIATRIHASKPIPKNLTMHVFKKHSHTLQRIHLSIVRLGDLGCDRHVPIRYQQLVKALVPEKSFHSKYRLTTACMHNYRNSSRVPRGKDVLEGVAVNKLNTRLSRGAARFMGGGTTNPCCGSNTATSSNPSLTRDWPWK